MNPKILQLQVLLVLLLAGCGAELQESGAAKEPTTSGTSGSNAPGGSESSQALARSGPARMTFATTTLDFGEIWDTEELVGKFQFENTGGEALVISEVEPSCGCTTTELSKMRFEPGEKDSIDLVWDPIGFGSQAKKITVKSNSEGPGIQVLTIQARIKPFVTFEPQPLDFGVLDYGKSNTRRVFMKCVDPDFELLSLNTAQRNLTAEAIGRRADGAYEIELTFDESTPWGQINCALRSQVRGVVKPGESPREHEANLNIQASVFGDLRADPSLFLVGHVLPKRKFEKRSHLTSASGAPFQVTSAKVTNSKPPGMQVRAEPIGAGGAGGYNLILSGDAADYEGIIRAQVLVQTDIPGETERRLSVMGIVRP